MTRLNDLRNVVSALWVLTGVLLVLTLVFQAYYPVARIFKHTFFESVPPGLLISERFGTLDWWMTALFSLAIIMLFWVGFMIANWKIRWPKVIGLILSVLLTLWWITCFIIFMFFMANTNLLAEPNNPGNSYQYCCAPEHFPFITTCPNFPADPCSPPTTQADLRINGDIMIAFTYTIILALSHIAYIILIVLMMTYAPLVLTDRRKLVTYTITETGQPALTPIIPGTGTFPLAGSLNTAYSAATITKRKKPPGGGSVAFKAEQGIHQ